MEKDTKDKAPKKRGRKLTGRQRANYYLTEEEDATLRVLLQDMRRGEPPVRYGDIKERADEAYEKAVQRQANGMNKPRFTLAYYHAEALYKLIGTPCNVNEFKRRVADTKEELDKEHLQKQKEKEEAYWEQWIKQQNSRRLK